VLYYTDWFPVVGGLLGLGGLFAWVAFVSGLLTDERKEQFQKEFERRVLLARRTCQAVLLVGAVLLLCASAHGSIVLQSLGDGRDRRVEIGPAGAERPSIPGDLPPNTVRKDLVLTGWWRRSFRVKVSGLPAAQIDVAPFQRRIVATPSAFVERPVVLIRPEPRVSNTAEAWAERSPLALVVRRGEEVLGHVESYGGEAVWVGCDADVLVPDSVISRWRLEMLHKEIPEEVLTRWSVPLAVAEDVTLQAGDTIRADLLFRDGRVYVTGQVTVQPLSPGRSFVRELHLDLPRPSSPANPPERLGS